MRFHVVSLPHTQTTTEFVACAYTEKVRKFCAMMKSRGHTVYLYAGEKNEAPCDELIACISEAERAAAVGNDHYTSASFDWKLPHWRKFNANAIAGIMSRAEPRDFICLIAGIAQKEIADALPNMMSVEFGIGYGGTFSRYRVWESYAWMHTCYGAQGGTDPHRVDGHWFDAVIPNAFEPKVFPLRVRKGDYFLYMGRLIERKGYHIAIDVCRELGVRLIMAGPGVAPEGCEHVGVVGPKERAKLMGGARALFAPTIYLEPFGGVVPEAMLCGTPVITSDWGAFTETNIHGLTGFRCRMRREFVQAARDVGRLDPRKIRAHAMARYSTRVVAGLYQSYFERLSTLWGDGWTAR